MFIPAITGVIDRRILINYQVEPEVLRKLLPKPFTPKLVEGKGIAGICLIRLKNVRPKVSPFSWGIASENGAHRVAVEWIENGTLREGVYIPRRDSSSGWNVFAGGRFFPGIHHKAKFTVKETSDYFDVGFESDDRTSVHIKAHISNRWTNNSIFHDQSIASDFFKHGSIGYSPAKTGNAFDGIGLHTDTWEVAPLRVLDARSSFFDNKTLFPEGSIRFDNALLMRNIVHEWRGERALVARA